MALPGRRTPSPRVLRLVPIYLAGHGRGVDALRPALERALGVQTQVHPPAFDPEVARDASRGQYSSRTLLLHLLGELAAAPEGVRILGVTSVDLFIPVLTFVFGEAQLGGRAAVVSTHRLRPEAYGLAPDDGLVASRLLKEMLHEMGHTAGLVHCEGVDCVMRSSTYVEEIDLKPAAFCGGCLPAVRGLGRGREDEGMGG